jgi:uncharacterized membrane protein
MTAQTSRILPSGRVAGWILVAAAAVAAVILYGPRMRAAVEAGRFHGPDLGLFAAQPMVLQLHILAALGTVAVGGLIFSMRKGQALHRTAGWIWVVLMATTAFSSLFIVGLNGDVWSLIHLLSGWVLVTLPLAVFAARKHRVSIHRRAMTGMFVGGSLVAGGFTFLPGRLMWALLFG